MFRRKGKEEDGKQAKPKPSIFSHHRSSNPEQRDARKVSMFVTKPKIAFVPEEGLPSEILQIEEKLEQDHHRRSIEASKRRLSTRSSIGTTAPEPSISSIASLALAQKQQTILAQKQQAMRPTYSELPRPFRDAMKDVEKRRKKLLAEFVISAKESYNFTDKEKRIKYSPNGCLIFHILEFTNVRLNDWSFVSSLPISYYCILSIGPIKKVSKIVHSALTSRIRMDYSAHFSFEVPEWRESPLNRFILELWSYQDPEMHYVVGVYEIHAYEFVKKQHAIERGQLWSDGLKAGSLYYEFAFSYGVFGYGHSNQLRNPSNALMETVCHSMYPRIKLAGEDLVDKVYSVRMPQHLKIFTYNSLILEVSDVLETEAKRKKRFEELESKPIVVQQVTFEEDKPVHCKLHMNIWQKEIQPDFNDTYGEFICLGSRRARMEYLQNLAQGRMRDLFEEDVGSYLFVPFKNKEAERIQRAAINHPGHLVHPTKFPCQSSLGKPELSKEDEEFQNNFPTARRGPGYLATLFGFEEKPEPREYLNDVEAPLYKEAGNGTKRRRNWCGWLWKSFLWLGAVLNLIYNFIFPEIRKPPPVPELSVTTPTPEGSTTKVYTYFVKNAKDSGTSQLHRLQVETKALIDLADNPTLDQVDSSSDEGDNDDKGSDEDVKLNAVHAKKKSIKNARKSVAPGVHRNQSRSDEFINPKIYHPEAPDRTGPGGHFKMGLNQPL